MLRERDQLEDLFAQKLPGTPRQTNEVLGPRRKRVRAVSLHELVPAVAQRQDLNIIAQAEHVDQNADVLCDGCRLHTRHKTKKQPSSGAFHELVSSEALLHVA